MIPQAADLPPGLPPGALAALQPDEQDVFRLAFGSALAEGDVLGQATVRARRAVGQMHAVRALEKAFDPSQARDEDGKWTATDYFEELNQWTAESQAAVTAGALEEGIGELGDAERERLWGGLEDAVVFHGTTRDVIEDIANEGLVPQGAPGADQWLKENWSDLHEYSIGEEGNKGVVFLTTDYRTAVEFANYAQKVRGGEPVVLAARIPLDVFESNARPDPLSPPSMGAIRFEGTIEPDWLRAVNVWKARVKTVYVAFVVTPDVEKFDPTQARAEDGKWTSGGGGGWATPTWVEHEAIANLSIKGKPITVAERRAIEDYTDVAYAGINSALRDGQQQLGPLGEVRLENLDALFDRVELSKDIVTYRFVHEQVGEKIAANVGGTFVDKGFVSTTTTPDAISDDWGGGGRVRVELPRGSPALPIGHLSSQENENEVLIDRGLRYNVRKDGNELVLSLG